MKAAAALVVLALSFGFSVRARIPRARVDAALAGPYRGADRALATSDPAGVSPRGACDAGPGQHQVTQDDTRRGEIRPRGSEQRGLAGASAAR